MLSMPETLDLAYCLATGPAMAMSTGFEPEFARGFAARATHQSGLLQQLAQVLMPARQGLATPGWAEVALCCAARCRSSAFVIANQA